MGEKMKVLLYGRNIKEMESCLGEFPCLELCTGNPDIIITYGGDGALLGAEREFPGILKFPVRDSVENNLCKEHCSYSGQIKKLLDGKLKKMKLLKLSASCRGKTVKGINDVFIHNSNPVSAIRYRVWIDGEPYGEEIVGDGVGVSTVHGSTAYYRSITHSIFRTGIGLAFSNSTEVTNHLVLPEDTKIKVRLSRGPAILVADNCTDMISLQESDEILFFKTDEFAEVCGLDIFMCQKCRSLRHPRD